MSAATTSAGTQTLADASAISGSTGCNRFTGSYEQDGGTLSITLGATTMMACADDLTAQEAAVLMELPKTASFTTSDGGLQLLDDSGAVLLVYAAGLASLEGTSWQATGINNGKEAVVSTKHTEKVTAIFGDDGTISGSGGCNTYSGPYTTSEPNGITIGPLAATQMACTDDDVSAMEQEYFAALAAATTYTIEGDRLTLRDADGATQVSYRQVTED